MIIRNGIRSTLRAKGRSLLFTLLIFILTLTLTLGAGMWAYCRSTLAEMDSQYTSIALAEYMGGSYPDADTADEDARRAMDELDSAALSSVEGVRLWETDERSLALAGGYQRSRGSIPYENRGVVLVFNLSPLYQEQYVQIGQEDMPEEYIAEDTGSAEWTCEVNTADIQGTFPLFYLDENHNYFREVYSEDNNWQVIYYAGDELPETFVYWSWQSGYHLYTNGTIIRIDAEALVRSSYDGSYMGWRQVMTGYTGIISRVLYTQENKSEVAVIIETGDSGFAAESGKRYLIHGEFVESSTANRTLAVTDFYEGCETKPWQECSGSDDPALTDSLFAQYAEYYSTVNNYVSLVASDGIAELEPFQQGSLYLTQGRYPEAGEEGVCVVSGDMAAGMELTPGSSICLNVLASGGDDRFDVTDNGDERTFTVVGITNTVDDYSGCVWVSRAGGGFGNPLFGYGLGRAVLDNSRARQAADELQAMMPDGVLVTLYDQGYSAAAKSVEAMYTTSVAVTLSSAAVALAVLFLFAYLFVGRQRETVSILTCLGTPRSKIRLWLLSGATVIAAFSAFAGALAGRLSLSRIISAAMTAAQSLYAADLRYSEAAVGVTRTFDSTEPLEWWTAPAAGIAVFAAALVLCLAFLGVALRQSAPKRGKISTRAPKSGTSVFGRGAARFAFLSAKRGDWRSAVVPAAALALCLLLGILASGAQGWSSQMDELYDTAGITGQATGTTGRWATNLSLKAQTARELWKSGMLNDISVSLGWHYWLDSDIPEFGSGSFARESRMAWIGRQPQLVALNSLSAAPAFYYTGDPGVTWLDGWDESFLSDTEYYSIRRSIHFGSGYGAKFVTIGGEPWLTYPCVVSSSFLDSHGLSLGDEFTVTMLLDSLPGSESELYISLKAVGSFSAGGAELYVPLSFWCEPAWITGNEDILTHGERAISTFTTEEERDKYFYSATAFSTCRFTLSSARRLEDFRNYLYDSGFSEVGRTRSNRTTIILHDQSFTETAGALGRYITFSRILFPVLFLVVGLLGFVISWLMINGRRMEFAILRGLGAPRKTVFLTFFLEQGGLCLLGCAAGGLILTLTGAGKAGWLAVGGFLVCYLAGCALSVLAVGRTHLLSLLSERE